MTARSTCAWARKGPSAADVIAKISERDLANVIFLLGEERHSRAVARAIVAERQKNPIVTTGALADIVGRVVRSKPGAIHPATRTFQALRLFVNEELSELATALLAAERILRAGGRLSVVSFHSLEDRIVKTFLAGPDRKGISRHAPEQDRRVAAFTVLTKKPVAPGRRRNRKQSARAFGQAARRRTHGLARPGRSIRKRCLPRLPSLTDVMRGR